MSNSRLRLGIAAGLTLVNAVLFGCGGGSKVSATDDIRRSFQASIAAEVKSDAQKNGLPVAAPAETVARSISYTGNVTGLYSVGRFPDVDNKSIKELSGKTVAVVSLSNKIGEKKVYGLRPIVRTDDAEPAVTFQLLEGDQVFKEINPTVNFDVNRELQAPTGISLGGPAKPIKGTTPITATLLLDGKAYGISLNVGDGSAAV